MSLKHHLIAAFGLGAFSFWLFSNLNEWYTVRDVAQAYVGNIRRIDLALSSSRFWIGRDLDSQLQELRCLTGSGSRNGRQTKKLKFKGLATSQEEIGHLKDSMRVLLLQYQRLLADEYSVDLNFSFAGSGQRFELLVEISEK